MVILIVKFPLPIIADKLRLVAKLLGVSLVMDYLHKKVKEYDDLLPP